MTDRHSLTSTMPSYPFPALIRKMEALASAGVDWIQLREKDLSAKELAKITQESMRRVAAHSEGSATRVLVNDRLDVALSVRAGGVHLGENGLPVAGAKRLIETHASGKDFLIGVSCHSLEAANSAADQGASYIFFGPVFATPSKAAFGAPQGLGPLGEVCRSVAIPVLAIGGVTLENAAACFAAGASGIAAIRMFQDAPDPAAVIAALRPHTR